MLQAMLKFEQTRNGETVPVWKGRALVSRFDPRKEAERFIRRSLTDRAVSQGTILIAGDCCGYLARAARELYPDRRIIGVMLHPALDAPAGLYDERWLPGEEGLDGFLSRAVHDEELAGISLLQWSPAFSAFGRRAETVMETILRRIRIGSGNLTTVRAFGPRWIRNMIQNFLYLDNFALPGPVDGAMVIAASGPSLRSLESLLTSLPSLLVALPSSLTFLRSSGRRPDLLVQTDPGFWADYHLREEITGTVPIAAPLQAVPSIRRSGAPFLLLNYGDPFEELLIATLGVCALKVPAMGTVAATAMDLCLRLGADPLVFAGLDLCYRDIHTHVRPHSFDPVFASSASRTAPLYSRKFRYSRDSAAEPGRSRPLQTYGNWFSGLEPARYGRVSRFLPSETELPFPACRVEEFPRPAKESPALELKFCDAPSFKERRSALIGILTDLHGKVLDNSTDAVAREISGKLSSRPGQDIHCAADELLSICRRVEKMEEP
jgi:6-hydroxymethylpterin diphosphokinase MptE-like